MQRRTWLWALRAISTFVFLVLGLSLGIASLREYSRQAVLDDIGLSAEGEPLMKRYFTRSGFDRQVSGYELLVRFELPGGRETRQWVPVHASLVKSIEEGDTEKVGIQFLPEDPETVRAIDGPRSDTWRPLILALGSILLGLVCLFWPSSKPRPAAADVEEEGQESPAEFHGQDHGSESIPSMNGSPVRVRSFHTPVEAQLLCSLLHSLGIGAAAENSQFIQANPLLAQATGGVGVVVGTHDLARALQALEEFESGKFELDGEAPKTQPDTALVKTGQY